MRAALARARHRIAVARSVCRHGWRIVTGRASLHIEDHDTGITRFTLDMRRGR